MPMSEGRRYERVHEIAAGGMATVYLGRTTGAGGFERLVAIKVMHPHLATDPQFLSMFLDEARVAASIRHPNVVSVLDVDVDGDDLALVMDYVEGPSLNQLLRNLVERGEQFPIDVGLKVILDALEGLHAAHQQTGPGGAPLGIVHRDVSPHNILIGIDGGSRITDFGVAYAQSKLHETRSGQTKGKLSYMSPEQLCGEPVDRRSDVYSMGVVLWEVLSGERLFAGENEGAMAVAALEGVKRSPRELRPDVPLPLDRAVMRALQQDPARRYESAAAMSDALSAEAAHSGITVASSRAVSELVQQYDEERPTRMRPQAAKEWLQKLRRGPDNGSGALAPLEDAPGPRTPLGTLLMMDQEAQEALGTPSAPNRANRAEPSATDRATVPEASAARRAEAASPPNPHGDESRAPESSEPAIDRPGQPPPIAVPAKQRRVSSGPMNMALFVFGLGACAAAGWFVRPVFDEWLSASERPEASSSAPGERSAPAHPTATNPDASKTIATPGAPAPDASPAAPGGGP